MSQRLAGLRIGIDLDNTLINYDRLFHGASVDRGLVPVDFVGTKRDIRDRVRLLADGETEWQRLQAHVYGPGIGGAVAAAGALDFVRAARATGAQLAIVSHKTRLANLGARDVDLRIAAIGWLRDNGFLGGDGVPEQNLYFEDTRAAKIGRIVAFDCTHFIDDLEEVFDDPAFPAHVERMLLTAARPAVSYPFFASFDEIRRVLIAG